MNKITLLGFLGKDFEMKISKKNETIFANNSLAVTKRWTNKNGNIEEHTDWIPIVLLNKSAENAKKFFKKGDRFLCEGELNTSSYIDEETGKTRYSFSVMVRKFYFISSKKEEDMNLSEEEVQTQLQENEIPSNKELNEANIEAVKKSFGDIF